MIEGYVTERLSASTEYRATHESTIITAEDFHESLFQERLKELMSESHELAASEGGIPISEGVLIDAMRVFGFLSYRIEQPDIVWLEDGGVSLEWRSSDGKLLTVSVYGDGHIIWGGLLGKGNFIKSICSPIARKGTSRPSQSIQYLSGTLKEHFSQAYPRAV